MSLFLLHMIDKSANRRKLQRQFKDFIAIFGIICFHFCQITNLLFGMKKTDKFQTNFFFSSKEIAFFPWNLFCPLLQHFPTHQSLTLLPFPH